MNFPSMRHEPISGIFDKFHIDEYDFHLVLHRLSEPEPIEADPHDHPFGFTTHILRGGYIERVYTINPDNSWSYQDITRHAGTSHYVPAGHIHLIHTMLDGPSHTLILPGPHEQEWSHYRFYQDGYAKRIHNQPDYIFHQDINFERP